MDGRSRSIIPCTSAGVVDEVGGRTSHAAVVSRELGLPAIVGCGEGSLKAILGQPITLDGSTGEVFAGELPLVRPAVTDHAQLSELAAWAAEHPDAVGKDHPLLIGLRSSFR